MFFVVRSNDNFNFLLGLIKYIIIANADAETYFLLGGKPFHQLKSKWVRFHSFYFMLVWYLFVACKK